MSDWLPPGTVGALVLRPWRIPSAMRSLVAMAPAGWWRHRPFLPLPDPKYWRFRLETSGGGDGTTPPSPDEVTDVVAWTAAMRRYTRHRS